MPNFSVIKIDEVELFPVVNREVRAAMKACRYAWQDVPDTPERIETVLRNLNQLYTDLIKLLVSSDPEPEAKRVVRESRNTRRRLSSGAAAKSRQFGLNLSA